MKLKIICLPLIFSILFFSCQKKNNQTTDFDYGTLKKNVYTNHFFHFQYRIPTGWAALSEEDNRNLNNSNTSLENKTAILLTASQFALGSNDSVFNPNIIIIAENLKGNTKVKNADDYLMFTRKALENEPVKRIYLNENSNIKTLNSVPFSTMKIITTDSNKTYSQDYYTRLANNYALTIILTYSTEDERIVLENSLKSLKFN
jgi:hypothetical protein